jgi:CRISPR-associated exonuclease Cas4
MFLTKEKGQIQVSELSLYFSCARKLYYSCRGYEPVSHSSFSYIGHLILKEMAMSYPYVLKDSSSKDDVTFEDLDNLLLQVLDNIKMIYPVEMENVTAEILDKVADDLRTYFPGMQQGLSAHAKDTEILRLSETLCLHDSEPFLSSEKLNMIGMPYRLAENGVSLSPVIIKTGNPPENGVWLNDRLHITSFAMLAEDMNGRPVNSGYVLYARSGLFRNVIIRSTDRRYVLQAIGRVRKIKEGKMPDKKESALCDTCIYSEMCHVKPSLISKFF